LNDLIFASKPGILEIKRQLHEKIEELREKVMLIEKHH
jgi:hypothetical protein